MFSGYMFVVGILALGLDLGIQSTPVPTPPSPQIEITSPTPRNHTIIPRCGGLESRISTKFDGRTSSFIELKINGKRFGAGDLERLNGLSSELRGDVFTWVECDAYGAILILIEAQFAGTPRARSIRLNVVGGQIIEISRYNFPTTR